MRLRTKAAGKRAGVYVIPHMLRYTFATQLLNAGCDITSIQMRMGHKRLNTTMTYAHVHDEMVANEYFRIMEEVEGPQFDPEIEQIHDLIDQLEEVNLTDTQRQLLEALRHSITHPD